MRMRFAFLAAVTTTGLACATSSENTARRDLDLHENVFSRSSSGDRNSVEEADSVPDGTLESYISYAMRNSPELEALFERWQAGVHRIAETRRLPNPVISYAFYIRNVETKVGPQRHRLSLKQSFPWPTKLSAGSDAASAKAQSLQQRFDARAIAIGAAVEDKYWAVWGFQSARKIHEEHFEILKGLSESASALLMTGKIELADQQQIDLTTARIEDLLFAIDEQIVQAATILRGIIGAPQSMPVTVESSPQSVHVPVDEKTLLAAVRSHPHIHSFEDLARASEAEARRETASRFPSFGIGVDWIETGESSAPNVPDNGKDAVLLGVSVSVPLWQRNYKESVEAYESESRAHRASGRAAVDRVVAEFYAILSELRDAKRRLVLYETTLVPQAQSVFDSVVGTYVSGKGSIASMLLAERDLLDLRVQLIDIRTNYARRWAALENLVGHEVMPGNTAPQRDGEAR